MKGARAMMNAVEDAGDDVEMKMHEMIIVGGDVAEERSAQVGVGAPYMNKPGDGQQKSPDVAEDVMEKRLRPVQWPAWMGADTRRGPPEVINSVREVVVPQTRQVT